MWDCFKVLSQSDAFTLVKAIRTIYGLDLVSISYPDIEIAIDVPEAEVTFTLVTNKKHKGKGKVFFFPFISLSDFRNKTAYFIGSPSSYNCDNLSSLQTSNI